MNLFKPYRYLHKSEIELSAEQVLAQMQGDDKFARNSDADCVDPSRVAEFLGLDLVWDHIPSDTDGLIAARIFPTERLIEINEDMPELREGLGSSTIAHEVGHWVLHINHDELNGQISQQELSFDCVPEKEKPFLCRSMGSAKGIEWQAQYFAGCLLMPRVVLEDKLRGRVLTRWPHLYAITDELNVTISNLTNRLQGLGLIYIPKDSKRIYTGKEQTPGQISLN